MYFVCLKRPLSSSPSLEKLVRDTVHRAYWDVLASELHADPPIYGHAIKLLEEIKEVSLLSFCLTTKVQEYSSGAYLNMPISIADFSTRLL